jgi:hypothetical protein
VHSRASVAAAVKRFLKDSDFLWDNQQYITYSNTYLQGNNRVVKKPLGRPQNYVLLTPKRPAFYKKDVLFSILQPEPRPKDEKEEYKQLEFPVSLDFEA